MKWDSLKQGRYYKVGQVLQSGATFVTKWDNYYKGSAVRQMRQRGEGNIFWQLTPDLPSDRHFTPMNS